MDVYKKSISLLSIVFALMFVSSYAYALTTTASSSEVITDVSVIKKKGKTAIKVDFAFPMRYVSHDVLNRGLEVLVNLQINSRDVTGVSLPLLRTIIPQDVGNIPLEEVTYLTEADGPKLSVKFRQPVEVRVSQVLGMNSLLFFLPKDVSKAATTEAKASAAPSKFFGGFVPEPAKTGKKMDPKKLEQLFNQGKTYLRNGENKKAINLFSSLLSLPQHEKTMECLELLGLARERNGQEAHARSIYEEYIKRYPKDKSTDRIKQRLADLSEERMQPKQPLKKSAETRKSKLVGQSFFYGSIAQYYDNTTRVDDSGSDTLYSAIDTQINLFHRHKSSTHDWRNTLVVSEIYEKEDGSRGINVGNLYSRYKDNVQNFSGTIGRHRANNIPGAWDKFDGLDLGAQATEKIRLNLAAGYPVSTADKQHIQTYKTFKVFNVEFSDVFKGWDFGPFVATQKTNSIVSRSAYGSDFRFYHEKGDAYGVVEYDQVFNDWVTLDFQTRYELSKNTNVNFHYQDQKNVDLENALSQLNTYDQVQDIIDQGQFTVEKLAEMVKGFSANSKQLELTLKHSFSPTLSLTGGWTRSVRDYLNFTLPPGITPDQVTQDNYDQYRFVAPNIAAREYSLRLVTSESFHPRDSTIMYYAYTVSDGNSTSNPDDPHIDAFTYSRFTINYRRPFGTKWRTNTSLNYRVRQNVNTPEGFTIITPKLSLNYYKTKQFKLNLDFYVDMRDTTSELTTPNTYGTSHDDSYNVYMGYIWDF